MGSLEQTITNKNENETVCQKLWNIIKNKQNQCIVKDVGLSIKTEHIIKVIT